MRKLVESTFVTLDGVIGDPQVWGVPYWDAQHREYATGLMESADALVPGRETYENFAAARPGRSGDPYTDKINAMPKHVATRTLSDLSWNATPLAGDVGDAVAALKQEDGGDLLKFGTGELDQTLLARGLLDELHLWVFPVIAGKGDRLLDGRGRHHAPEARRHAPPRQRDRGAGARADRWLRSTSPPSRPCAWSPRRRTPCASSRPGSRAAPLPHDTGTRAGTRSSR
ncbi:dihydrofolate reductase family protein [Nocardioides sp. B-3]|uniref:dihydrofolate reductase family protein n=1 Tax=Nocardioides sp. B-3 TaxID=2895565 RepID=UPI0021527516|nr:dihydrofolate reductase family protein [Nocardioides sp. B-3]UUZ60701.1 dihydrofolate reductase family protein [Nocardioides sp. B-3]